MAISQHGRLATQKQISLVFKLVESAEEISDLSARYLQSENLADFGKYYWIIAPPTSNILCHLIHLQQLEIAVQNVLHSQVGESTIRLREHMSMGITYQGAFLRFKKQLATTYSLWERAHQKALDQHSNELTLLLILDAQLA